jgi:hypothetical protein
MAEFPSDRPRVFLSHSKADSGFIERLYGDLQKCQIYPWLDTLEIRHGQPWLDAIFEGGIPTCDCVLVYLTKASSESQMVKKEIDAAIIKKLRDKRVAFIPYVSDTALREMLRVDIQALQTPEWNERNYSTLLPCVVAEIWRSFMERRLITVASEERAGRLEAELQLERVKTSTEAGIFSKSEEQDFSFVWKQFNRYESFRFLAQQTEGGSLITLGEFIFDVNVRSLVPHLDEIMHGTYDAFYSVVLTAILQAARRC